MPLKAPVVARRPIDAPHLASNYSPAKPGALLREPLKSGWKGPLTRPLRQSRPSSG
jgi:hypothetical protein